jgi:hypothetical protein
VPAYELRLLFTSPVPTQIRRGIPAPSEPPTPGLSTSVQSTATAPIVIADSRSKQGVNDVPWLRVCQSPPDAYAT